MGVVADYHELEDWGCCLICEDGYEGCICYNCKCSKCKWYSGNDNDMVFATTDMGGKWCTLVDLWREKGNENSEYQIFSKLIETPKAFKCTLKRVKVISKTVFWIPKSILNKNYVKKWFVEKEKIRSNFNAGIGEKKPKSKVRVEKQTTLFSNKLKNE